MKYLPLVSVRGALLAAVIRDSYQDPRRHSLCTCCGSRMLIKPDLSDQTVRCPGCSRLQRVTLCEEVPWRPLHPPTGKAADKAFFDELSGEP